MSQKEDAKKLLSSMQELFQLYQIQFDPNAPKSGEPINYAETLAKTQDKLEELNTQAKALYEKSGMTKEQLEAYAADPKNFTKEQWEMLQHVKSECEAFKKQAREVIKKETPPAPAVKPKQRAKLQPKKKGWLQI